MRITCGKWPPTDPRRLRRTSSTRSPFVGLSRLVPSVPPGASPTLLQRIFPKPSVVAYKRGKNLKDLLVRAKVCTLRKSNRKLCGYSRCDRGFFNKCVACNLIPTNGIKTHQCNKTKETFKIDSLVNCVTTNVIYRITCKKPKCKNFVYIGQTKRRFCDRFSDHRGYVSQKKYDQVCGEHFNKPGHSQLDMLPVILEEVTPKNDDFLRLRREELWIRKYQSIEFGANKHSWIFLYTIC